MRCHEARAIVAWIVLLGSAVLIGAQAGPIAADPSEYAARIHEKAEELGFTQEYDTPPKAAHVATAVYPESAVPQCVSGTVMVLIGIDERGRVVDPEVLESIPEFDEAALDCVRNWRFTPAERGGHPVGSVALAPVSFEPPSTPGEPDCWGRIAT